MVAQVKGVNPDVLKWARKVSGYHIDDVAKLLKRESEEVSDWENGLSFPTWPQLEALAYKVYKRPIAVFFFPEPPNEPETLESFRTLPLDEKEKIEPKTRFIIRNTHSMQLSLIELCDGLNPMENKIFRSLSLTADSKVQESAILVREFLGISSEKIKKLRTNSAIAEYYRNLVQDAGVFVFKNSIRQKEISGFCLLDDEFPVILLNNSNPFTRQTFTLFHELTHILLGENGITTRDDSFVGNLPFNKQRIEIFCNQLAGEILMPAKMFEEFASLNFYSEENIRYVAEKFGVSREVVVRRALDLRLIDKEFYETSSSKWVSQLRRGVGGSGGNYYATQASYLGNHFRRIAFDQYQKGKINLPQLAEHLNVKTSNVARLEPLI